MIKTGDFKKKWFEDKPVFRVRPLWKRVLGLPKMWYKQNKLMRGIELKNKVGWFLLSARILLKPK